MAGNNLQALGNSFVQKSTFSVYVSVNFQWTTAAYQHQRYTVQQKSANCKGAQVAARRSMSEKKLIACLNNKEVIVM